MCCSKAVINIFIVAKIIYSSLDAEVGRCLVNMPMNNMGNFALTNSPDIELRMGFKVSSDECGNASSASDLH